MDFAYWWSFIGKGLRLQPAQQACFNPKLFHLDSFAVKGAAKRVDMSSLQVSLYQPQSWGVVCKYYLGTKILSNLGATLKKGSKEEEAFL